MTKSSDQFLFGAVVGSGMTAQVADRSGADYLLVLNAGRFRVQGASSLACFLPIRDANKWVFEFAEREILGRVKAPIYAGLSVSDPNTDLKELVRQVRDLGFQGVCNFPSNALLEGRMQKLLESEGLGYSREIDLVRCAKAVGLDALVYVVSNAQAHDMHAAGATTICVNLGFTSGPTGVDSDLSMASASQKIDQVLDGLPADMPTLCAGGPIITPEDAMAVWRTSNVQGYITGSSLDRLPIEQTLEDVASGFRVISQLSRTKIAHEGDGLRMIGSSAQITDFNRDIEQLAKEDAPVLILGETGTGKSKAARLLHQLSARKRQRLSIVDCPGLELETGRILLMGAAGGALKTGLSSSRGALEAATRGTVLFDGIDSLKSEHQGQILRFAEDGTVQRLGDPEPRIVSARIVATAAPTLLDDVAAHTFRADLYYRLAVHQLLIPPLRDRIEDVPELVDYIAAQLTGGEDVSFTNSALKAIMDYSWPGNVRELQNVVARAIRKSNRQKIVRSDLQFFAPSRPALVLSEPTQADLNTHTPATEKEWISAALARHGWRRANAAEELGMSTRTLFNKIKKYNLDE
ncbi:MAG: phosphoenolpyruvate hydrolase family protein [Sulfitobacter sp.]